MWAGFGFGQKDFIGYGATIDCQHCHNRVVEQVFVTYSYEEIFVLRLKHMGERGSAPGDGSIIFMCPTCNFGFECKGQEAADAEKDKLAKKGGGAAAAKFAIESEHLLTAAQERFDLHHTANWVSKLNPLKKISYFKLLRRLGLLRVASQLSDR